MHAPWIMIDVRPDIHAGTPRCQGPSRRDESLEFGEVAVIDEFADLDRDTTDGASMGPSPRGGVFDDVGVVVGDRHLSPEIGEPVGDAGNDRRDETRDVQAAEPHSSPPVRGHDVGADIGLGKC